MSAQFKRTHYINDIGLQFRYMGATLLVLVLFFAVAVAVVYFTGWTELVQRLSAIYPQGRLLEILEKIYLRLFVGFLILVPVAVLMTLYLSHAIAGPLVRIKRYLRLMAKGDFDLAPIVLRPFDELKDVAELVNEVTARMGPRSQERKKVVESLRDTAQSLRADLQKLPSTGQEIHRKINYLNDTLKMLE
jgi:methyl-accepting chemotaxis protein